MKTHIEKTLIHAQQEIIKEFLYCFPALRPRKILFDHLPKCGGTSLKAYLGSHYLKKRTFLINGCNPTTSIEEFKHLSQDTRYTYDLVQGHSAYKLFDDVHPDSLKVTILREPVDRIISFYHFAKSTPKHYLYSKIQASEMNLEDFATSHLSSELRNWYTTHFSGLSADEAESMPEEAIMQAVDFVLKRYTLIGFLDNLSAFAATLRRQAKLRYAYQNLKLNVTKERPCFNDIEPSTIRAIEQVNQLDIVLYRKIREARG